MVVVVVVIAVFAGRCILIYTAGEYRLIVRIYSEDEVFFFNIFSMVYFEF